MIEYFFFTEHLVRSDCRDAVCCKFYRATRMTIVGCQRTSLAFLSRWLSPENIRKVGTKAAWTVSPNGLNASISPLGMKKKNALGWWSLRKGGKYLTILAGPVLVLRIFSSALQKTVAFPRSGMENDELDIPNLRLSNCQTALGWVGRIGPTYEGRANELDVDRIDQSRSRSCAMRITRNKSSNRRITAANKKKWIPLQKPRTSKKFLLIYTNTHLSLAPQIKWSADTGIRQLTCKM